MKIQLENIRRAFKDFDWKTLFIEELLWNKARPLQPPAVAGAGIREIAHLGQIPVYEITTGDAIPETVDRRVMHAQIAKTTANCLLIFVDEARTQTLWLWAKREKNRFAYRESVYIKGQTGEAFLAKIAALFADIETESSALKTGALLKNALDVSKVTTKFYNEWKEIQIEIAPLIQGLPDDKTRAQYSLVLLHRLMFVYFLQRRIFIDENPRYLENKLEKFGDDAFFQTFLKPLFFEGFAQPEAQRSAETVAKIGDVKYLNGGLFLPHPLEREFPDINVPDAAFEKILRVFGNYDWADDSRDDSRGLLSPELLGFIFEKFINDQKSAGAYYTPEALTSYLCERTIEDLILDEFKNYPAPHARRATSVFDLIGQADPQLCREIWKRLKDLRVLDPAVGSGAFLVAALYTFDKIYFQLWGRADYHKLEDVKKQMLGDDVPHARPYYAMCRRIITHNLYSVDLMEGAPEIARLRLFLALVSIAKTRDELEPLPNIDFNILEGNSLIGYLRAEDLPSKTESGQITMGDTVWSVTVLSKQEELRSYMSGTLSPADAAASRDRINALRETDSTDLDNVVLQDFNGLGIRTTEIGPDGKPRKRALKLSDIEKQRPFHWAYEFPEAMEAGGFDAIITNPPWEVFKPNGKEFLQTFSETITKKTMSIKEFEAEKDRLIADPAIKVQWDEYQASFPYVSEYFRKSPAYLNQISVVNGKKAGTDINLYKLFVERCFDLLQPNGRCGIVIPSGIYTDLGAKQLREMLFEKTQITGLFGFENRKTIFEGVDSRFKFVALTWAKSKRTEKFPAAFMRHDVNELAGFPNRESLEIGVDLVRKLSPDSLSVMEFKSEQDVEIAQKMLKFPMLGEEIDGAWKLKLATEFHMTNDSKLFQRSDGPERLPLYEGKMFWQFDHDYLKPKYWIDTKIGRAAIIGRKADIDEKTILDYQDYRFGYREIASATNERTMVSTVLPPNVFCNHKIMFVSPRLSSDWTPQLGLYLAGVFNSFVFDYVVRQRGGSMSMFMIYQMPVPRLTSADAEFAPIVSASARLICTTPEFDDLAREAGLRSHADGVAAPDERAALRAQLDARIARLYGLSESEFAHILATFPLVDEPTKLAARNAFRDLERGVTN